jgi:hypothetical protein
MRDRIYDLQNGSMITDRPIGRRGGHSIWSAEALLEDIGTVTAPTFLKPFYFLDVLE